VSLVLAACLAVAWQATAQEQPPAIDPTEAMLNVPVLPSDERAGLRQFTKSDFNSGDLAWTMTGTVAALLLLAPGLAVFYCGMSHRKRVPEVLVENLLLAAALSLTWVLWIYSLAFSRNEFSYDIAKREIQSLDEQYMQGNRFIGGAKHLALRGLDSNLEIATTKYPLRRPDDAVPHLLIMIFQLGVFIAAAAPLAVLMTARFRLGPAILFLVLWGTVVYAPTAYWVWGGGWHAAALDYAGGIVVHFSVGCSALSLVLLPPSNRDTPPSPAEPDLACMGLGTLLFWGGSLLVNAGHAQAATATGVNALVATHLAASAGILGWSGSEWLVQGSARLTGSCQGAMSGLFAIAAGCGYVAPQSAILIGLAAGVAGQAVFRAVTKSPVVNPLMPVFALQGIGGGLGVVLAAVFATASVAGLDRQGDEIRGVLSGNLDRLTVQGAALGSAAALAIVGTYLVAWVVRLFFRRGAELNQHPPGHILVDADQ
jgi:Amt family ammonium transporter